MEILVYGLVNSMILVLYSIGFTFVYGICRLPNFAHGAIYILTGFGTWLGLNRLGMNYGISLILCIVMAGIIGALIYQTILIRVRGMPISEIIATYAAGMAILEFLRWGGLKGSNYSLPPFEKGMLIILGVPVDMQRVLVIATGVVLLITLWAFTRFTKTGRALRGMAQDERAALMLGINSDRMALIAMGVGCSLAGLAAAIVLPLGNITVESGYNVLILAIAVCIVGGLGSWKGAILAALIIGFLQILTWVYIASHYQMVAVLLVILITLTIKPSGIFGKQKELEERV